MSPRSTLEYLTFRDLSAPEFVVLAAAAGFDSVGLRLHPADAGEVEPGLLPGSESLRVLGALVRDLGIAVLDIEVFPVGPDTSVAAWEPRLEAGAQLGARFLNVVAHDPDVARLTDTLSELVVLAGPFGLRPAVEPMAWKSVRDLETAATIAASAGALVQLDTLHLHRAGDDVTTVAGIDPTLWSYVQLSDAPLQPPSADPLALRDEGRTSRLPPGDGGLPLRALLDTVPAGLPRAVEAPSAALRARLGDRTYAARLRSAMTELDG